MRSTDCGLWRLQSGSQLGEGVYASTSPLSSRDVHMTAAAVQCRCSPVPVRFSTAQYGLRIPTAGALRSHSRRRPLQYTSYGTANMSDWLPYDVRASSDNQNGSASVEKAVGLHSRPATEGSAVDSTMVRGANNMSVRERRSSRRLSSTNEDAIEDTDGLRLDRSAMFSVVPRVRWSVASVRSRRRRARRTRSPRTRTAAATPRAVMSAMRAALSSWADDDDEAAALVAIDVVRGAKAAESIAVSWQRPSHHTHPMRSMTGRTGS